LKIRFSIIIIHRNNRDILQKAINSICSFIKNDELIIVDNNSDDNSIEKIETPLSFKVIKNKCNAGYGFACNQGMKIANGDYFLLCNNDIELKKDTLDLFESMLIQNPKAGIIGPQMFTPNKKKLNSYSTIVPTFLNQLDLIGRPLRNRKIKKISHVSSLRGACLAVNKEMTRDVGMYDESFYFYHEETEWCLRINKTKKWKIMFAPEIEISHIGGSSTNKVFAGSRIEFFRSRILLWKKIFSREVYLFLLCFNTLKLFLDFLFYLIMFLLTFGISRVYKRKLIDRVVVISWLAMGRPNSWGLPNKCT